LQEGVKPPGSLESREIQLAHEFGGRDIDISVIDKLNRKRADPLFQFFDDVSVRPSEDGYSIEGAYDGSYFEVAWHSFVDRGNLPAQEEGAYKTRQDKRGLARHT